MLFHVYIQINIPHDADQETIRNLSALEVKQAQELQHQGSGYIYGVWLESGQT